MSYEHAIPTRLLATHCVFCGRSLRDPESVERGWGPECNEKYAMGKYMPEDHDAASLRAAIKMAPGSLRARWEEIGGSPDDFKAKWNTSAEIRRRMLSIGLHHGAMAASYGSEALKTINERVDDALLVIAAVQNFALAAGYTKTAETLADRYTQRLESKHLVVFVRDAQHRGVIGVHTPYSDQWNARCRAARDIFFRSEKKGYYFYRYFHEKNLGAVVNMLQGVFGDRLALMDDGRLLTLPAIPLPAPVPETPPSPPPSRATGELPRIPAAVTKLKVGDKVKLPGGGTSIIQYINPSKQSIGVGPEKGRNYVWFSFSAIETENGQKVATELYGVRKRENEREGLGEAPEEVRLPRKLPVGLRSYQIESLDFVEKNRRVLVADEQGLGKSVVGAVAIEAPAIVVCPSLIKVNWVRELNRWRPELRVALIEGSTPPSPLQRSADVIVINYDVLHAHLVWLKTFGAATLIADEAAHYLKNLDVRWNTDTRSYEVHPESPRRAKAFYELHTGIPKLLLLTGTPILNRPREIYPLLHMLDAQTWSSGYRFCLRYCGGHEIFIMRPGGGSKKVFRCDGRTNSAELHDRLVKRYMVRHTKAEVLKELPPKERRTQMVSLSKDYKVEYRKAAQEFLSWITKNGGAQKAFKARRAEALNRMTALRSLSARGKVEATLEWIEGFFESTGRPLVVMGIHRQALDMIASGLDTINMQYHADVAAERSPDIARPIRYTKVLGGMSDRARNDAIDAFQAGEVDVILYSIAIATGTTLTRAQEMLFIERMWRPADQVQAEDRIHRFGQENACVITYLDAEGTIDAKLGMLLMNKATAAAGVIDGVNLDREESMALVFGEMFDVKTESGGEELPDVDLAAALEEGLEPNRAQKYVENPQYDALAADSWNQPI